MHIRGKVRQMLLKKKKIKVLKGCLWWKVHLAYAATLQALHSNT